MSRVTPRADRVSLGITLTYRVAGDDHWLLSRITNMSETGILFGPTNLKRGAKVELIIASPIPVASAAAGRVVCLATIARTTEAGAAAAQFDTCRFVVEA
jgi:hypothetical protein